MKAHTRVVVLILSGLILWVNASAVAEDVHFQAAGAIGFGYVGMYYGLTNPAGGAWYEGEDFMGLPSTSWLAVVDTGASATILGRSTQDAYAAGTPIPMQDYPAVKFSDTGFGGTEDFAVTHSVQVMLAGQKAAAGDTENHSLYTSYAPPMALAAACDYIGGGVMDMDIIGTSILQGQVLQVDPHSLELLRFPLLWMPTMAGSLGQSPPLPSDGALYIPMTMRNFFTGSQAAEVGDNPMIPMKIRRTASDDFAERSALFDTGSPVNFVSESFAIDAGIDTSAPAELMIPVSGVGDDEPTMRDGWYVNALALKLGGDREGDDLVIGNTAVFVIPDDKMPCALNGSICLDAILGNGILSHSFEGIETTIEEWYVDMRDSDEAYLVVVLPEPATASLLLFGALAILRRRKKA